MHKTVLITGASSGIGRAFAFKYAEQGENLILTARTKTRLDEIKAEIEKKYSVKVDVLTKDLSKEFSAMELYEEIKYKNMKVDILINNAGLGQAVNFMRQSF